MLDIFLPYHKLVMQALNNSGVRYLIIGGYAVVIYGYNRGTADLDIWLEPTNANRGNLKVALTDLGFAPASLDLVDTIDFEGEVKILNIGEEPNKIDFLTRVQGIVFEDAYRHKQLLSVGEMKVPVVQYEHLLTIKMLAGRKKDLADIEELAKVNRNKT